MCLFYLYSVSHNKDTFALPGNGPLRFSVCNNYYLNNHVITMSPVQFWLGALLHIINPITLTAILLYCHISTINKKTHDGQNIKAMSMNMKLSFNIKICKQKTTLGTKLNLNGWRWTEKETSKYLTFFFPLLDYQNCCWFIFCNLEFMKIFWTLWAQMKTYTDCRGIVVHFIKYVCSRVGKETVLYLVIWITWAAY